MRLVWIACLLGLSLLACGGSSSVPAQTQPPPPPPPEFKLEIRGPGLVYAGEAASIVSAIRAVESPEPSIWSIEGPGVLALDRYGAQPASQGGGLYFIPPATVSGGGDTTTKVYYTTKDLYNGGTKKSPELVIQVKTLKIPMSFQAWAGTERTLGPSGKADDLGARVSPLPFPFSPQTSVTWKLVRTAPTVLDPGSLALIVIQNDDHGSWAVYTAPPTVTQDFDVTITATTHDPWFNLDPVLTWTIHVKKN